MSSVSSQPQFRYTQPPSKVLHLRNLPWECTEEELIELGKPFGKVVNTKCNVGANRNQAFIEFAELNQAIAMISYYASSSEPAQVRGKTVYLQYSNRQEIVNNKTTADVAGNVLLVTIEGNDARLVSIDVLHLVLIYAASICLLCMCYDSIYAPSVLNTLVFSAFGLYIRSLLLRRLLVFRALFSCLPLIRDALKRSILGFVFGFGCNNNCYRSYVSRYGAHTLGRTSFRRYLIPELGPCSLRITYSAHTDLSVKFQSHRSRDYTNPLLPVAPSAIDASGQFSLGVDGKKLEPESNVLLASIENMQYAVTLDVLHTVFSAFGPVLKIAMFDKNGGLQALIQYPEQFRIRIIIHWICRCPDGCCCKEALEGHCIYDGGYCKLHISYSRHTDLSIKVNNDRSRDYTIPSTPALNSQPSLLGQQPYPVGGPGVHAYGGGVAQYASPSDPHAPPPAGWNPAGPAPPQSMPMQMHNYPYGPPAGAPAMGPGPVPPHGQNGLPHSSPMRPYHHQ
ncbi:UNVERIFIED_CONTAM: Polypyrimidine tract-binding protein2 [Sesamum angustifolium]|uniref:Polypyrimidine tract-binding protein2 n=1 Tax=Sesamum angustifolium TaxID=2727405 RepID=A0AAW2PRJ4_9LAMI